jgi:hypothetical protein
MSRGIVKVRTICGWGRVLVDAIAAHPVLYAIDAATMAPFWQKHARPVACRR